MGNKKVKHKLNKKALLVILLALYLIIMTFYYVFTMPIKSILINGNTLVSDSDIIKAANIGNYPSIFKVSSKSIINNVNKLNNTYVLSNKEEINCSEVELNGIPTLVNYVPSDIYEDLIEKLSEIDSDIISSISEIEYNPDIKDEVTINEGRFILRMNDGNHIYIDIVNFENLNKYKIIYSSLDEKGVLHLDVVYSENNTITFTSFAALAAQQNSEEGEDNELSQ